MDKRIADIMLKMKGLSAKHPLDTCGEFPPRWDEPLSEERVAAFEKQNGIKLPEDYRRFITTVVGSGTQPFYGLVSIAERRSGDLKADLSKKFPFTLKNPLNIGNISDEEYQKLFGGFKVRSDAESDEEYVEPLDGYPDFGFIELCEEGCGMFNILIVNALDEETCGTVWFYDLADDAGIFPLAAPETGKAMRFLDWLEYYVDRSLALDDEDYFSYGELAAESI
ncbi:MAG: SMI1/KNR4 family protein [Lachnospiraceae bacterium]|nr:SMI1/KNR4 family protein [Ruminococcus sp.]MCM1274157.1 SMI1/KNR4 family protein [Lachnospiraceae bacterium]